MGSKKALLIVLGLILLSSSVFAVNFEWALGDSTTLDSRSSPFNNAGSCFKWGELDDIARLPYPIIVATESMNGESCANRCKTHVELSLSYKGQSSFYVEHGFIRTEKKTYDNQPVNAIADQAKAGGTCDWTDGKPTNCGSSNCDFDGNIVVTWVQIDVSGLGSVFKEDRVKSIGSIYDLFGEDKLPPVGETVYFGLSHRKVIGWIGKEGEEYNDQKEMLDPAPDDYLNVCADANENNICDYIDAEPCLALGADWYKNHCCGEDPAALKSATNWDSYNCTYVSELNAFCGKTLDGRWQWAPKDDAGNIHELLGCPGYSMVSDGSDFINCKPGQQVLSFQQIFKSTCPAGTYTALSDYWRADYAYFFPKHPQSTVEQAEISLDPDWHFDICTSFQGAKAKAILAKIEENNLEPDQCDSGYVDIGLFSYVISTPFLVKGRVCAPASALSNAGTGAFKVSGTLGSHEYICSNGEIFECKGDTPAYTQNKDIVAETGITTFELLGSGGCPPNIISYWTFDNGTANDIKGSFNGNNIGAVTTTGKINGALAFDGADRIEIPGSLKATNEFTIEAWIKPTQTSGLRKVLEKADTFRIAIDSGILTGAVNTGAGMLDFGSRTVVSDVWNHVALTYDGAKAKLYLNGIPVEEETIGNVSWSSNALVIGGNFIGDVDDTAFYGKALRQSLIMLHAKNPSSYCRADSGAPVVNNYCAADGDWTPDLDIKDMSSCNKAGFRWTGSKCCSEADDIPTEYYNEHDTLAVDLVQATVAKHTGAQASSSQIILNTVGQYATIRGLAKLTVEVYSAESSASIGACPKIRTETIDIAPWENKTIRIDALGAAGELCRYRWKIITAQPILAYGGCWNKTFVERGTLVTPKILNYQGTFFGCNLPSNSPFLTIKDKFTNASLISNLNPTCSGIKADAAGAGNHSVCGPGGIWLYTKNADATFVKNVSWDPGDYGVTVLSESGCCGDDQCWNGFECVDDGAYYTIDGDAFVCRK